MPIYIAHRRKKNGSFRDI